MSSITISINGDTADFAAAYNTARVFNPEVLDQVLTLLLVRQAAHKAGCTPTKEALQKAMDETRYQIGMEKADAFHAYLKERRITQANFEASVEDILLRNLLMEKFSAQEVDAYLTEMQSQLEAVELYSMRLETKDVADELKDILVEDEAASFLELAAQNSTDETSAKQGGYIGVIQGSFLPGEIKAAVFAAKEGDIVGPFQTKAGFNLFKIIRFIKPDPADAQWRAKARQMKLEEILESALNDARAKIECSLLP